MDKPQITHTAFDALSRADVLDGAAEQLRARLASLARKIAGDIDRTATLMLCDGRARQGWRLLIVWTGGMSAGTVVELPPGWDAMQAARDAAGGDELYRVDVLCPGDMLSAQRIA